MAVATSGGGAWAPPPGLTDAQREAVVAGDPLLCVLAGAGAGKTRVLTLRVARRCHDRSAAPEHTLVCTFSRKAADELRSRLWSLDVEGPTTGTFHRVALSLLRRHRADRGLAPPEILSDRRPVLAGLVPGGGRGGGGQGGVGQGRSGRRARSATGRGPRASAGAQLDAEIGWAKARLVTPDDYERAAKEHGRRTGMPAATVADLYRRYEEQRRRRRLLDLDDLLLACHELLAGDAAFAQACRWRFRHLFVDEMQDVNPAQFRLLASLLGDEPDLCVVGDPRQSVYGWNGADPSLLDRLPDLLPGTRQLRLDENHRSSPQVVSVAAAVLPLARGEAAPSSRLPDGPVPRVAAHGTDADEAEWVARQLWLLHRPGRRWSQLAVLARTNAQLQVVAEALRRARLPHRFAGADLSPASDVRTAAAGPGQVGGEVGGSWAMVVDIDPVADGADEWSGAGATDEEAPAGQDGGGLGGEQGGGDAIVLATFHRAKGLQWPAVFVVGVSDGLVPIASARTAAAREEEQRLLYVALSRAETDLTCTWAAFPDEAARTSGGPPRSPSPWLDAIERACRELRTAAEPPDPDQVSSRLAALRADLEERLALRRAAHKPTR